MKIESLHNAKLKYWKNLKLKKYRDQEKRFLVYGNHLIEEAKKYYLIETLISSDETLEADFYITKQMARELCDLPSVPSMMAVVRKQEANNYFQDKILALDGIQDPDNLGALIRSALAFGFKDILLSLNCVDLYNEKVIRATQGAMFGVNILRTDLVLTLNDLKEKGYKIIGADNKNTPLKRSKSKIALVLGSEGSGLSVQVNNLIDQFDTIKTQEVESLNVSIAGAILMYEWSKE